MQDNQLPPLPKGVKISQNESLPPLPNGVKIMSEEDVKKKKMVLSFLALQNIHQLLRQIFKKKYLLILQKEKLLLKKVF